MGGMLWALVASGPRSIVPRLDRLKEERLKGEGLVGIDTILRTYVVTLALTVQGTNNCTYLRMYVGMNVHTYLRMHRHPPTPHHNPPTHPSTVVLHSAQSHARIQAQTTRQQYRGRQYLPVG